MNAHERGIIDAVARAKKAGLEPKTLYLSPDYREALQLSADVTELGGLPVKAVAKTSRLCCRHGIMRGIVPARPAAEGFSPAELLLLASLLHEWPHHCHHAAKQRLHARRLID